jgi:hypothetical protein
MFCWWLQMKQFLTYAMVCNTWWGGTWTRFGDSIVAYINIPNYSTSGVCYTTTSGIEAFICAIGGTAHS